MNKDFEMAKYLATIGSIFLIATTLFFQQSVHFEERFYEMTKSSNNLTQDSTRVANISLKYLENGTLYMVLGILLLTLSLIFSVRGYRYERKKENYLISELRKEL